MKIVVCGKGGHGKDKFCEYLGLPFMSSSNFALRNGLIPFASEYPSMSACYDDRRNRRTQWADAIDGILSENPYTIIDGIFRGHDVYNGMRKNLEFKEGSNSNAFDLSIWIDATDRLGDSGEDPTCEISADMCDITVFNNGSLDDLFNKAINLRTVLEAGIS